MGQEYNQANSPQAVSIPDLEQSNTDISVTPHVMTRGIVGRDANGVWRYIRVSASGALSNDDAANFRVSSIGGSVNTSPLSADSSSISAVQGAADKLRMSAFSDDAGKMRVSSVGGTNSPLSADSSSISAIQEGADRLRISAIQGDAANLNISAKSGDASTFRVSAIGGTAGDNVLVDGDVQTLSARIQRVSATISAGDNALLIRATNKDDAVDLRTSALSKDAGTMLVSAKSPDAGVFLVSAKTDSAAQFRVSGFIDSGSVSAKSSDAGTLLISAKQGDAALLRISGLSPDAATFRVSAIGVSVTTSPLSADSSSISAVQEGANRLRMSAFQGDGANFQVSSKSDSAGQLRISAFSNDGALNRVSAIQDGAAALNVSAKSDSANLFRVSARTFGDTTGSWSVYRTLNVSASQAVKATAGAIYGWYLYNHDDLNQYIKFYNTSGAINIGTDTPILTVMIPPSAAANMEFAGGLKGFTNGIGIAAISGAADDNTTPSPTSAVGANIFYV